jgi:meso-butanediol dehydrogenase / (S,S)-butanediol dehydrogenase / diacetyl reductase
LRGGYAGCYSARTAAEPNLPAIVHRLDARMANIVTRLRDRTAIVTGGGTGMGRAIAMAFGREGARVALLGRRREPLESVAKEITEQGGEAKAFVCDVTEKEAIRQAIEETEKALGPVTVLVNNAGIVSVSNVESVSEEDWDRVLDTNLTGPFLMCRAVLPSMRKAGGGSIINIGSVLGLVAIKDRAAYCASKGGLTLLTKAIALDHAHENIRVNCICPSVVETDLVKAVFSDTEEGRKARQARIGTIPLGRLGRADDVAGLAVLLASDESSWMTGAAIPVDGGVTAY